VDTDLWLTRIPGAWARCDIDRGGCGQVTCGAGLHLIESVRDMAWQSGMTAGSGYSMPVCQEGLCGNLYSKIERAIVAFRFPVRAEDRLELKKFKARAKFGPEDHWMTITAVIMLRVFEYYSVVKERLRRERMAELRAEEEAPGCGSRFRVVTGGAGGPEGGAPGEGRGDGAQAPPAVSGGVRSEGARPRAARATHAGCDVSAGAVMTPLRFADVRVFSCAVGFPHLVGAAQAHASAQARLASAPARLGGRSRRPRLGPLDPTGSWSPRWR
jgi:hypothetical protein